MSRTSEQFVLEMEEINPNIAVVGTYTKATERVNVKCRQCGKNWAPKAYSLLQGKGCPSCSAKQGAINNKGKTGLKTTEAFLRDLNSANATIQALGEYKNGHTNLMFFCARCGNKWEAKPYSVLQGHGCPRCAKSGTSFMEQFILLSFQEKLGTDKVLSRDKKAIGMELDIYIPELSIAFEPGNWWLHKHSFIRDKVKRSLCAEKKIKLITIYDNFPKNKEPPFADNCYIFSEDLNVANHSIIRQLTMQLFTDAGVNASFSNNDWQQIESKAYESAKSMTHELFVKKMQDIHPFIEIKEKYLNVNRRLLVQCKVCGFEWAAVPANMLSGDGCRKCGTKKAHEKLTKNQETFVSEVYRINPNIEIIGTYIGRHSPVKTRCKICGTEWEPIASSLLRGSTHKGAITIHKKLAKLKP